MNGALANPAGSTSILVVDDTPSNLQVLAGMLRQRGYRPRPVPGGRLALQAVQSEPPDLILLDIMMPEMDGFQVCESLKANALTRDIPIIFISARDAVEDKVRALRAGGVDYISKPFQLEEVLARVETHLSLRALQRQLQTANRRLEQAVGELQTRNAELDAFAHTVAHDLKNPLGGVLGFSSLLSQGFDTASRETLLEFNRYITESAHKMKDIIDSLLLLSTVRKQQEIAVSALDTGRILGEVRHRLLYVIEEYQPEISMPAEWPQARGYAPWVEEIWANYISNALKYGGHPPRIELGADLQAGPERMVRFWVRDNGPGLSPEEQARLFTPFTRFHEWRAEGHGLGLSIVQRIAERLGGQAGAESEIGRGSTFYFTLPAAASIR